MNAQRSLSDLGRAGSDIGQSCHTPRSLHSNKLLNRHVVPTLSRITCMGCGAQRCLSSLIGMVLPPTQQMLFMIWTVSRKVRQATGAVTLWVTVPLPSFNLLPPPCT